MPNVAKVLQLQVESTGVSQFKRRRWNEGNDLSGANRSEGRIRSRRNRRSGICGAFAFAPILQMDEGNTDILALPDEAEASNAEYGIDIVLLCRKVIVLHPGHGAGRFLHRRARRQRDLCKDYALILFGQES